MRYLVWLFASLVVIVGGVAGVLASRLASARDEVASCRADYDALYVLCRSAASELRRAATQQEMGTSNTPELALSQILLPYSSTSPSLIEICAKHPVAIVDRASTCRLHADYHCIADIARQAAAAMESASR